uniref:Uncharacterized protein n=1 Tax=Parascaris univalens TaxID=6257 RepID=A0A915A7X8_PARUN
MVTDVKIKVGWLRLQKCFVTSNEEYNLVENMIKDAYIRPDPVMDELYNVPLCSCFNLIIFDPNPYES